jgi:hypothetical protein
LLPSAAVLRLATFLTFVAVVLSLASARVIYADVKEAALSAGHELAGLSDATHGAEVVWFNGARFHHGSVVVDATPADVLNRLEAHCEEAPNVLGRALLAIPEEEAAKKLGETPSRAFRHGVFREDAKDGARGMVICFVDDRPYGFADLKQRLESFHQTHDVTVFGRFRYGYAEKLRSGKTHVVTMWMDSGLDLRAMFPPDGDAAGSDSVVLPRPPHSRRTLAANAEDLPYSVRLYDSADPPEAVRAFYDAWMKAHGFDKADAQGEPGASYIRPDGFQAILAVGSRHGKTGVSLVEAGRADGTSNAVVQVRE